MKYTYISDSGKSGWYLVPDYLVSNVNAHPSKVCMGTATGQTQESEESFELPLDGIPTGLFGHIMASFQNNILVIGIMCDKDCKVLFTRRSVIIYDNNTKPFLTGCMDTDGSKLWRIWLKTDLDNVQPCTKDPEELDKIQEEDTLGVFSAYAFPYLEALVKYFHGAARYPVWDNRLKAIKAGNYEYWPGITYNNAAKYYP